MIPESDAAELCDLGAVHWLSSDERTKGLGSSDHFTESFSWYYGLAPPKEEHKHRQADGLDAAPVPKSTSLLERKIRVRVAGPNRRGSLMAAP